MASIDPPCWQTVLNLADYYQSENQSLPETSKLSPYYPALVTSLVSAASRYARSFSCNPPPGGPIIRLTRRRGPTGAPYVRVHYRPDSLKNNLRVGALNALTALVEMCAQVRWRWPVRVAGWAQALTRVRVRAIARSL